MVPSPDTTSTVTSNGSGRRPGFIDLAISTSYRSFLSWLGNACRLNSVKAVCSKSGNVRMVFVLLPKSPSEK